MSYQAALLKQNRKIFTTDDLAVIWQLVNRGTLRTTIHRYLANQILFQVRKGLYSVVPLNQLDPKLIGTAFVKGFCYVSLQTVLVEAGLINQQPQAITLVGSRSQQFSVLGRRYICKKMKSEYLHHHAGIILDADYPQASPARAMADMWYYQPRFFLDQVSPRYLNQAKKIQKKVFL